MCHGSWHLTLPSLRYVHQSLCHPIDNAQGKPIWQATLNKRLAALQNDVVGPRKADRSHDYATELFRFRMKDHFKIEKTGFLFESFIPQITHPVEGLIFTPIEAPYGLGGYEAEQPIFHFIGGDDAMAALDGSLSKHRILQHIDNF